MNYLLKNQSTKRLNFRILKKEDFDSFIPLFEEEGVATFLGMDKDLSPIDLTKKLFDKTFNRYENNLGSMNVLIDKVSGDIIGMCGILVQTIEKQRYIEIGYFIIPKFWNKGYASEAAIKCRDYAFENEFTSSLISMIHKENRGSELVAIRNGMKLYRDDLSAPNENYNLFRITKSEWRDKLL